MVMQSFAFAVRPYSLEGISLRISSCLAVFFSIVAIQITMLECLPKTNVLHTLDKFMLTLMAFVVTVLSESTILHAIFNYSEGDMFSTDQLDTADHIAAACVIIGLLASNSWIERGVKHRCNEISALEPTSSPLKLPLQVNTAFDFRMSSSGQLAKKSVEKAGKHIVLPSKSLNFVDRLSKSTNRSSNRSSKQSTVSNAKSSYRASKLSTASSAK